MKINFKKINTCNIDYGKMFMYTNQLSHKRTKNFEITRYELDDIKDVIKRCKSFKSWGRTVILLK